MAMKLAMTVNVKAMATHRWACRIQLLKFNQTSPFQMFFCGVGAEEYT